EKCGRQKRRLHQTLTSWDFRLNDRRDDVIHMILVAQQAVLTRHVAGMAGLAELFFHCTEIGCESLRISLFVAFQIRATLLEVMAGQATAIPVFQGAEMRLMDEFCEAALLALERGWGEIDDTPFARDVIDTVTFRA